MSSATTQQGEKESELDRRRLRAMPVEEAVKYAFRFPPGIATILLGPPGIGKTELVIEYARREAEAKKKEFVELNEVRRKMTREEYRGLLTDIIRNPKDYYVLTIVPFGATMPDDLLGVPQIVSFKDGDRLLAVFEESALKGSLAILTVKDIHGVLLIDDALNANDNVRRSFLQAVLQERLVGGFDGVRLSPNVRVIATGNLTSESELSVPLQKPMVGRAWMVYTKPNPLHRWYENMESRYGNRWFREIYAFLNRYNSYYARPDLIEDEPPTGPIPRAWTKLSLALKSIEDSVHEMLGTPEGSELLMKIAAGFVGVEAASQLVAFLKKPVVSVDEVVRDPGKLDEIVNDMDMVFRFAVQLGEKIKEAMDRGGERELALYLKVLYALMTKSTRDVGVFVYDMLTHKEKSYFKKAVRRIAVTDKSETGRVAREIYRDILGNILSDVILDMGR